ncbi:MAG: hypothetical protein ACUVQY_04530 [Thermoproteota archaeon]
MDHKKPDGASRDSFSVEKYVRDLLPEKDEVEQLLDELVKEKESEIKCEKGLV